MTEFHYFLSTHWDLEFYGDREHYRMRLATMLDNVFAGWQSGKLRGPLYLDGQTAPLEDYLEVRPEMHSAVQGSVAEQRLVVGPWFAMPDLFLVSGESLVRNLELGQRQARELGSEASTIVNCCDCFGHTGQMPQIYRGMGLSLNLLWRGVNAQHQRNFRWVGRDGSIINAYRFGLNTYWSYAVEVRRVHEREHRLEPSDYAQHLKKFMQYEAERTAIPAVLLFDGKDHGRWDAETYAQMQAQIEAGTPIVHRHPDEFAAAFAAHENQINGQLEGELREPLIASCLEEKQSVISSTLSFRRDVKQANAYAEMLLTRWAEPFHALLAVHRIAPDRQGFLDLAWRTLLRNHAHDTICGSVNESAMPDVRQRFDQARRISELVAEEALTQLCAESSIDPGDGLLCLIANPSEEAIASVRELDLWIPVTWGEAGSHELWLIDGQKEIRLHEKSRHRETRLTPWDALQREIESTPGYRVRGFAELDLPGLGYRVYRLERRPASRVSVRSTELHPATGQIANEFLSLHVGCGGSIDLTDLQNGERYRGMFEFHVEADAGSPFNYEPVPNAILHTSRGAFRGLETIHQSDDAAALAVNLEMKLPEDCLHPSGPAVTQRIRIELTLLRGDPQLRSRIVVDNVARNHRMTLRLVTDAPLTTYWTGNAFDAMERTVANRSDLHEVCEPWHHTAPIHRWIAGVQDARGLAVFTPNIYEGKVDDSARKPIELVLLRSGQKFCLTGDQLPSAQCLGQQVFELGIRPVSAQTFDAAELTRRANAFAASLRAVTLSAKHPERQARRQIQLPSTEHLIHVPAPLILSSCRLRGDDLEVRVFNTTDQKVTGKIKLGASHWQQYALTELNGQPLGDYQPTGEGIEVTLAAHRIGTLRFKT